MTNSTSLSATTLAPSLFRTSLLALSLAGIQLASGQAIYTATEHAEPGGAVSVRGDALDKNAKFTVYPYSSNGTRQASVTASLTQSTDTGTVAVLRLPSSLPTTVYELAATTSKGTTNSVFLNKPRIQWADAAEAMQSGTVRLIGRNFKPFANVNPVVTLTSAKGTFTATVTRADDGNVNFVVPATLAVGSYTISLNNGLAGTASTVQAPAPLSVRPKAADPFSLNVSWGSGLGAITKTVFNVKTDSRLSVKAKADATSDDTAAINAAINAASKAGGGTVYLPAGTYRVGALGGITIPQNVALKGDGKGKTILQVGYSFTASVVPDEGDWAFTLWGEGTGRAGLVDLTIQNLNLSAKPNGILRNGPSYAASNYLFVKNVEFNLGNGRQIQLNAVRNCVMADCDITSTSLSQSGFRSNDMQNFQFVRNKIDYRAGRTAFTFSKSVVLEDNRFLVDNLYHVDGSAETGGVELSYSQQVLFNSNEISGYNGRGTKATVDGELLGTQAAAVPDFCYVGSVRAVSGRLLIPATNFTSTSWLAPSYPSLSRFAVMIVSGKGAGQWRWASSWTSSSVMVDTPWQIVPDSTSRFAINSLSNYQQTYSNNRISNGYVGISIYSGSVDSAVTGNTVTNAGSIILRSPLCARPYPGSNYALAPTYDTTCMRNSVSQPDKSIRCNISAGTIDVVSAGFGMLMAGVDIRYNTVAGSNLPFYFGEQACNDGLEVCSVYYNGLKTDKVNNVGTILEGNIVTNATTPIWIRAAAVGEFRNLASALESLSSTMKP